MMSKEKEQDKTKISISDQLYIKTFNILKANPPPSPSVKANTYRRLAVQLGNNIVKNEWDPLCSFIAMEEYIQAANELVDDQKGLNNYAEACLNEAGKYTNHSSNWKSELTLEDDDIKKFISSNKKQERKENEDWQWLKCMKRNPPANRNRANIFKCSSKENIRKEETPDFSLFNDDELDLNTPTTHINSISTTKLPNLEDNFPSRTTKEYIKSSKEHFDSNNFNFVKKQKKQESDFLFNSNKPQGSPPIHNDFKLNNQNSHSSSTIQSGPTFNSFKTAGQQLAINKAKEGKKDSITQSSYGSGRRNLGTRPGPSSGFKPPVRSDSTELEVKKDSAVGGVATADEEEIDPRYKNIDMKMVETIKNEIMDSGEPVTWDDIAGLEFAKDMVKEIVVWPMLRPDIFKGLRGPPKGLLLFGPPGTGKTLIGKCIACQSGSTFFSISASSLTSKWVGDGEKMVRALFAVAKVHQPSVVFIDEIDSLLTSRSEGEHESSRKIKTEFLVQLDGASTGGEERVLVVGATNRPQELDEAARRRLVKRLYIPLPELEARKRIITNLLGKEKHKLTHAEIEEVSRLTEGYSGADMANLCKEAAMGPIRSLDFSQIASVSADQVRPILHQDLVAALRQVKASVGQQDLELYKEWNKQYGAGK